MSLRTPPELHKERTGPRQTTGFIIYPSASTTPFIEAVRKGDLDKVKAIVTESGQAIVNKDKDGDERGALFWASATGSTRMVSYLLELGANVHGNGGATSPFWGAVQGESKEIARMLWDKGAKVDQRLSSDSHSMFPLWQAAISGREEMVKFLVEDLSADTTLMLYYSISWSGLTGPATAAHFHRGAEGANGPVVLPLLNVTAGAAGSLTGFWDFSDDIQDDLWEGNVYVNIHSARFPDGEIRDQVNLYATDDCY